jgi:hypothetical protein
MKRLLLLASAIALGALVVPTAASAASGDVQSLDVGDPLVVFDDGDKLAVEGEVECRVEDTWGLIMKAIGPGNRSGDDDFQEFGEDERDFPREALGMGGPGSGNQGPVEQPCSETGTEFDLVLEKLGSSNDFTGEPSIGLWAIAAESPTQQADPAWLGDGEIFFGTRDVEQED